LRLIGHVPDVDGAQASLVALALTAVVGGFHLAAPALRRLPRIREATLGSLAGGAAVAYVFLQLLPELAQGSRLVAERLSGALAVEGELEIVLFLLCLVGFTAFYALERLAERHRGADHPHWSIFTLHLGAFALHNMLITFTMRSRVESGLAFAALFAVALGLHFMLIDRALAEHHPRRFNWKARALLLLALLAGWAVSLTVPADTELPIAVATALLAGSVLWHAFRDEIPTGRQAHVGAFSLGVVAYGTLLAVATFVTVA
jgi:hypothetical protein